MKENLLKIEFHDIYSVFYYSIEPKNIISINSKREDGDYYKVSIRTISGVDEITVKSKDHKNLWRLWENYISVDKK